MYSQIGGSVMKMIGGTIQAVAAYKTQQEMFDEYKKELKRQGALQNEAFGTWQQGMQQYERGAVEQRLGEASQMRQQTYQDMYEKPLVVGDEQNKATGLIAQQSGEGRANIGKYGDWWHGQGIESAYTGMDLAHIANTSRGWAGVFPMRMYQAQHSQDALNFWGEVFNTMGSMGDNAPDWAGKKEQPGFVGNQFQAQQSYYNGSNIIDDNPGYFQQFDNLA